MTSVRAPAVAGSFYSDDSSELQSTLEKLLEQSAPLLAQSNFYRREQNKALQSVRAFIVPHAGYQYSGKIAASAYSIIRSNKHRFSKVAIIGPCHRIWIESIALPYSEYFATPLGELALDRTNIKSIYNMGFAEYSDVAHEEEHSIELHLPFIQACLNEVKIIPVAVGDASYEKLAKIITMLWDDPSCLIIISSDLSHFNTYDQANLIDNQTTHLIEKLAVDELDHKMACGCTGIQALLSVAKERSLKASLIAQCNSGDVYGDKSRVVGYGSYAIY